MANTALQVKMIAVQAGIPVLAWSEPGMAKTAEAEAIGRGLEVLVETVIGATREPSDMSGLPVIALDGTRVNFSPPGFAVRANEAASKVDEGRVGAIIHFDELTLSPPTVQGAMLRVVHERRAGDYAIAANVTFMGSANPPEKTAGAHELTAPMANRWLHVQQDADVDAWIGGMLGGFPDPVVVRLPRRWEALVHTERTLIASFIRARRGLLHDMPADSADAGRAWASRRTWDMAARVKAAAESAKAGVEVVHAAIAGCVGSGKALEFMNWVRELDLPDPEECLAEPKTFKLPKRGDQQFAVLAAISGAVVQNLTAARVKAAWTIFERTAEQGAKDVGIAAVKTLVDASWGRPDLPLPYKEIKAYEPMLRAVGLLPKA